MQLVAIDVGTGTQDVLVWDTEQTIENALQLVLPSPTAQLAQQVRAATRRGVGLALSGVIMGGGPGHWAINDHLEAGYPVYATPVAAQTFNDDLAAVREMGIILVSEDEQARLPHVERLVLRDLQWDALAMALEQFGVRLAPAVLAVAVFDHGNAPPDVSDRKFRFDYLANRLHDGGWLTDLAFTREHIPPEMTRLQAVASSAPADIPLLVMDTAPAAVLGALDDPQVRAAPEAVVANIGNFHALAFHVAGQHIRGLFEHHTGEVTAAQLDRLIGKLAAGTLTNQEVFMTQGHGALILDPTPNPAPWLATTGPRQSLLDPIAQPYHAVPHGAMMQAGGFGLLRAVAAHMVEYREAIEHGLLTL